MGGLETTGLRAPQEPIPSAYYNGDVYYIRPGFAAYDASGNYGR